MAMERVNLFMGVPFAVLVDDQGDGCWTAKLGTDVVSGDHHTW
jgi:hypothetical protein